MTRFRRPCPPPRTVDPLYDYYHSQMGFAGGGLRTMPVLGEKPHTMRFELNEWRRFDVPGRYRVYVVSKGQEQRARATFDWRERCG
ncbi:MAG: hypothetical protein R3B13_20935 [Polyangiaceae bacterium]